MARFIKAKDIKVGVIGYGGAFNMGKHHLTQMHKLGMIPVAVTDVDPSRLEVAAEDFPGIQAYTSVNDMLRKSDVNLLAIVTPHNTHAKLAIQCLGAGRQVVMEKPFAITTAQCDAMIHAAKKNNVMLTAYHNRHWDGCVLQAIKTIGAGAIGDVVRVEAFMGSYSQPGDWWRSSQSISGGILYDWGVHLLEYSLQIIDDDLVEVSGFAHRGFWAQKTKWKNDTNEDEGIAIARFKRGAMLSLCITHLDARPRDVWLQITGTRGTYLMNHGNYQLIQPKSNGQTLTTKGKSPPSRYDKFYRNIVVHLTKAEPLIITPQWARRPIHILDLANKSAQKGASIKAKYK